MNSMCTTMQDLRPIPPPVKTKEDILIFFKLYDPLKEELRYFTFLSSGWSYISKALSLPSWLVTQAVFLYFQLRWEAICEGQWKTSRNIDKAE